MKLRIITTFVILALIGLPAFADSYSVSVGYADGIRGAGFFPSPWAGSPNVVFVGTTAPSPDAGAIMITNTSGGSITVNDISVNVGGTVFDLWGSNTLATGQSLIVTATANYNFDTSDVALAGSSCGHGNSVVPTVTATVDGVATTFNDSGQVLNTSGYDFACQGNESFAWRPIGTTGGPAGTPTPEPGSLTLLGTGLIFFGRKYWNRFISA